LLLFDELRDAWRAEPRDYRLALVCIAAIAVALRLMYMGQPMRYDEAVTYMYFVRLPWADALSLYTYPNNHLFHTLLAKATVSVFGNAPWAIRLPALVAGLGVVAATYAVARVIYGARAALIATAIVGSSGVLVLYSTNARGYSLVVLAFLLLILVAIRLLRGAPPSLWLVFAGIAALGLWTIPVMLYPLGAVCIWFALSALVDGKGVELRRLLTALGVTAGLTLLLYLPVISREGLGAITRNKFVSSSGWFEFFEQLPDSMKEALRSWSLGLPPLASLLLLACAVVALRRHSAVSSFRIGIPLAAFLWCAWLLVVNHRAPFPRVWLWFFPIAASLAGAGIVVLLERWRRTQLLIQQRTPALAVGLSLVTATSVMMSFAVLLTRDTGTYREAEDAATALKGVLQPGDRVLAAIPSNGPLAYYFDKLGLAPRHLTLEEDRATRIFAIVDRAEGQTLESVVGGSRVRDPRQFAPAVTVAEFPASTIFMFSRRDAAPK
jgi:hypothetical protein